MKKIFVLPVFAFLLFIAACGPAAEDREQMMIRSKVFQDSIANVIRVSMAEAEAPGNNPPVAAPAATSAPQPGQPVPTPAPNTNVSPAPNK